MRSQQTSKCSNQSERRAEEPARPRCCKCGGTNILTRFRAAGERIDGGIGDKARVTDREILRRYCNLCTYAWSDEPLDADQPDCGRIVTIVRNITARMAELARNMKQWQKDFAIADIVGVEEESLERVIDLVGLTRREGVLLQELLAKLPKELAEETQAAEPDPPEAAVPESVREMRAAARAAGYILEHVTAITEADEPDNELIRIIVGAIREAKEELVWEQEEKADD
jgi:hypothetical protein